MKILAVERTFESLIIGETSCFEHLILKNDITEFAAISGDYNPLHTDDEYAKSTVYKKPIIHGMFLGGLISRLIGMKLPGKYSLLMNVVIEFKKPVKEGDMLLIQGTISQKSRSTHIVVVDILIHRAEELIAKSAAHVRLLQ